MTAKLKLSSVPDDKPVKLSVELPPEVHRDLLDYAAVMARETGEAAPEPAKLIAPMLQRSVRPEPPPQTTPLPRPAVVSTASR